MAWNYSVMHHHVCRAVHAELDRHQNDGTVKIVDVGCGDGALLDLLASSHGDVHGLEVTDSGVQAPGFFDTTALNLAKNHPQVDWPSRLHLTTSDQPWPFVDNSIDVIVSNQVCEHVKNIDEFMAECGRVLAPGGFAIHVFPLQNYVVEGHTGVPFGHRILSGDLRRAYYRAWSRLRLSKLGSMPQVEGESSDHFARTRSDYVTHETANHRWRDVAVAAEAAGLVPSYRHTPGVYLLKLLGEDHRAVNWYYSSPHPLLDGLTFSGLSRVASVTVVVEKRSEFTPDLNALWVENTSTSFSRGLQPAAVRSLGPSAHIDHPQTNPNLQG